MSDCATTGVRVHDGCATSASTILAMLKPPVSLSPATLKLKARSACAMTDSASKVPPSLSPTRTGVSLCSGAAAGGSGGGPAWGLADSQ